jgi:deazaflavin-dependent oxidoreductase (nitroreductase family)
MRLTTIGRRSGKERSVILGYYADGDAHVTMAMNGWQEGDPAWWLNLQARPEAMLEVGRRTYPVRGRAAVGEEHDRLWDRWRAIDKNLDEYAALRSTSTPVVVFETIEG